MKRLTAGSACLRNWRAETKILFDISPAAFVPQPKVTSSVVRLVPRQSPQPCERRALEQVSAAAFGQRRKMLRQSLKSCRSIPQGSQPPRASIRRSAPKPSQCQALLPWRVNWSIYGMKKPIRARARGVQDESSSRSTYYLSMIFSENRCPPIGSLPEGMLFRIMP